MKVRVHWEYEACEVSAACIMRLLYTRGTRTISQFTETVKATDLHYPADEKRTDQFLELDGPSYSAIREKVDLLRFELWNHEIRTDVAIQVEPDTRFLSDGEYIAYLEAKLNGESPVLVESYGDDISSTQIGY